MKYSTAKACLALMVLWVATGCEPMEIKVRKKASHAELVVTYNAEVQALDRLEAKRKTLIADFAKQIQEQAIKDAVSSLQPGLIPSNPNEALDRAVASAEAQARLQSGLLEKLGQTPTSGADSTSVEIEYPETLKRQLTEIDAEIADQRQRVDKAKAARDASEQKS